MYAMKEEDYFQASHNIQDYQDQFLLHPQQHQAHILPWSLHAFDSTPFSSNPTRHHDPYGTFLNRRVTPSSLYDGFGTASTHPSTDHHHQNSNFRILSEALGPMIQPGSGLGRFGLQVEMGKMTTQEIMDAKALAPSKSHSEAERRRRERINNHLAKLRSILPSTTKTDKASLLSEVIQHVKELKRQTSLIGDTCQVPTEADELTVDLSDDYEEGNFVIKATICCQDRSDLMPDVIKALKALRLRILKAEITTLGGRVKNVLFITGEEESRSSNDNYNNYSNNNSDNGVGDEQMQYRASSIQEALKAVMEKSVSGEHTDQSSSGSVKRQRTSNIINRFL